MIATALVETCNRVYGAPGRIVFSDSPLGGPVVELSGSGGRTMIALQGAQVLDWTPADQPGVIWLSPVERLGTRKAVRGGTPVCWPWFGTPPDGRPAHGFVRTRLWTVTNAGVTDQGAWVALSTRTTPEDLTLWPHSATATLTVTLGRRLGLSLKTENTGTTQFTLTQALHTYFAISDVAQIAVGGFDGEPYTDTVGTITRRMQEGDILFGAEVDRIFDDHTSAGVIVDRGLNRRLTIHQTGSRSSVVWNPGIEKATRLADMGPDGWRKFVCVETTNAGTDKIELLPHASHTLGTYYAISPLQLIQQN